MEKFLEASDQRVFKGEVKSTPNHYALLCMVKKISECLKTERDQRGSVGAGSRGVKGSSLGIASDNMPYSVCPSKFLEVATLCLSP
jgi:hypothetical protein